MNAEAYLRKQGWQGSGHSLDSTGRGIKKPLLITHKQDQLGLGKKKAAHNTDDQWWMRAFDQSLQSIGTGRESTLNQIRTQGINRGGLYGFFVKGEAIKGTIEDTSATTTDASTAPSGTSTPPTSASDTDAPAPTKKTSNPKNKRKREDADVPARKKSKKLKGAAADIKPEAQEPKQIPRKAAKAEAGGNAQEQEAVAVAAKLAKLKPAEKTDYEARAAAKDQTLDGYILRRIQKKAKKKAKRVEIVPEPHVFFADLEGDPYIVNAVLAEQKKKKRKPEKRDDAAEASEEQPRTADKKPHKKEGRSRSQVEKTKTTKQRATTKRDMKALDPCYNRAPEESDPGS
ncbi:hypothetical protein BDW02DRAFT_532487 [Decorospora gaudefroyi]|uniref:G-patch domain-containing protein n=1 Tax=Decorospora gaudefroyi TaxID=184978 RepID=A0A6A5K2B5_9PLEO|nr:hypothetical protein BDW02DRAFT_532487 [Decorospora gaudefroyi]